MIVASENSSLRIGRYLEELLVVYWSTDRNLGDCFVKKDDLAEFFVWYFLYATCSSNQRNNISFEKKLGHIVCRPLYICIDGITVLPNYL